MTISKILHPTLSGDCILGEWIAVDNTIIIPQDILKADQTFLSRLIHEYTHSTSDQYDCTHKFETTLTNLLED